MEFKLPKTLGFGEDFKLADENHFIAGRSFFKLLEEARIPIDVYTTTPHGSGYMQNIYYNFTDMPISVFDSSNHPVVIYPCTAIPEHYLDMCALRDTVVVVSRARTSLEYAHATNALGYTNNRVSRMRTESQRGLGAISFINTPEKQSRGFTDQPLGVCYILTDVTSKLINYSKAFYSEEFDVVIESVNDGDLCYVHPRSKKSLLDKVVKRTREDVRSLNIDVYINDHDNFLSKAFVNICGISREVPVCARPSEEEGIYVTINGVTTRYDLRDENREFKVFDSKSAANTYGNPERIWEERINQIKQEQAETKIKLEEASLAVKEKDIELTKLKQEHTAVMEKLNREAEAQAAITKRELEEAKRRALEAEEKRRHVSMAREEKIEKVGFFRKTTLEVVKVVGVVLSAFGTFAAIYLKFKKG